MPLILLLGRILFSSIFIIKGFRHFSDQTVQHAIEKGVSSAPFLVPLAGVIALAGGLSILLGYKARFGAWLIVIFLLPTTFMIHQFWGIEDSYSAMMEQYCFMKNISLLGAALMITYFGAGPASIDHAGSRRG